MLNIYYGRESVDKEKFIYEEIMRRGFSAASPVIVLVPDQYTLEAERQAFRITGKEAFIGFDVYSISRLGHNVLSKEGQGDIKFIDKYGRQMLLTGLMFELKDDLSVYGGNVKKASFIEMVNDYISSLKQYDVSTDDFAVMAESVPEGSALSMKMKDLLMIYRAYDERIRGKYTDSEDYVELFLRKAEESEMLAKASIWVYGFDSFAPKSLKVLGMLMKVCREVNCVLTYDRNVKDEDLFSLTGRVMDNLKSCAAENGAGTGTVQSISEAFRDGRYDRKWQSEEIQYLEHELFAPVPVGKGEAARHADAEGVNITEAANYYNEAESAASYILHLVRDKKYRYRDIAVICNDRAGIGAAVERAFDEYGIPCFLDDKRNISGSGIAVYISGMISAAVRGMRTTDIFRALKTGLGVLEQEETEKLENYVICYRIDRGRWLRPFRYGEDRYGTDGLAELEGYRAKVSGLFGRLNSLLRRKQTYSEFLTSFYTFLVEDAGLTEKLERLIEAQKEAGLTDLSEETQQTWHMIISIMEQINNILGEEDFDADAFLELFTAGLKQAEIGIMPPSPDDLMIGTMQRTRVGKIKALVVVGANEGVIPQGQSSNGLFAEQEDELLAEKGFEACKSEKVRREEEKLAIYRNFAKPDAELWVSYTLADADGGKLRKSEIVEDLQRVFPKKEVGRDILNTKHAEDLISGRISTLRHLTEALVAEKNGIKPDPVWGHVLDWYRTNEPEAYKSITDGLGFRNKADSLGEDLSAIMLSGRNDDSLSVTKLESFALCPFAYFVGYGLRPEERRIFEAGSREVGDVYHESLMSITKKLTEEGRWGTVTDEELSEMVKSTLKSEREEYGEGLFSYTGSDSYRASRAEETIREALKVLVRHARAGKIEDSRYEEVFGKGQAIPPITVDFDGKKVYIEGKIDRLDILENGRVKIVDYKSGAHEITDESIRAGYTLQLMVYMQAAQQGVRKPAGVFYFYMGTKGIDVSDRKGISLGEGIDPEAVIALRDASMKGIVVDEPETISEIIGDDDSGRIASIKKNKDGQYAGSKGSAVISEEEFRDLQTAVDEKVRELAKGIVSGQTDIHPMRKSKENIACRYCEFKGICRFNEGLEGCSYNKVE